MIQNTVSPSKLDLSSNATRLFTVALISFSLSACDSDDAEEALGCDTYSVATAECFCDKHPDDSQCKPYFETKIISKDAAALTPHASNSTLWSKGFAIENALYLIDLESGTPHKLWKYLKASGTWEQMASFPGTKYGLVGAANGKGYASGYASKKFWEYDPATNQWNALSDLPFAPGEVHWVKYGDKFYLPTWNGVFEFNPTTKAWTNIYDQALQGTFDATYLLGSTIYWFDINGDHIYSFDLSSKATNSFPFPEGDFANNISFNNPFVLGSNAFIVNSKTLWIFNPETKTWAEEKDVLTTGAWADEAIVIENSAYIIFDGNVISFSITKK